MTMAPLDSKPTYAADPEKIEQFESVLMKLPAPIVHNKRLGEILLSMMRQVPGFRCKYIKPENLDVITCHNYPQASLLEKSLDYLGITGYRVLNAEFDGPWRNTLKLKWMLNHLEKTPKGPEYVLFCDADDTILKGDPRLAIDVLNRRQCELLFMSTSFLGGYACMPQQKQWADSLYPGRYLNSGVYVGRRSFLTKVLRAANAYVTDHDITAEESKQLGHGVSDQRLCRRLPEYPKGSQDQDILRYIHPDFYPGMQIDFSNELAFRNL